MKKKSSLRDFFSKYEQYLKWGALAIGIALAGVRFYYLPDRLEAAEKDIVDIKEYTRASQEEKKAKEALLKHAPPGFQWSETIEDFVKWPEDPRLKKK